MRRAAKRDSTEAAIIQALEAIGVVVVKLSDPGVPDLLCWREDTGYRLLEAKSRHGRLTPKQIEMRRRIPFAVVSTPEGAVSVFLREIINPSAQPGLPQAIHEAIKEEALALDRLYGRIPPGSHMGDCVEALERIAMLAYSHGESASGG